MDCLYIYIYLYIYISIYIYKMENHMNMDSLGVAPFYEASTIAHHH